MKNATRPNMLVVVEQNRIEEVWRLVARGSPSRRKNQHVLARLGLWGSERIYCCENCSKRTIGVWNHHGKGQ
jgi:hypothetical protein